MAEKETYFFVVGDPENYAKAYVEGDSVCFDIGQRSCGFSCGGQIIRVFPKTYAQDHSFDDFLLALGVGVVEIITDVQGEEPAQEALDEMWNYLCNA